MSVQRKGLGKGLSALFGDIEKKARFRHEKSLLFRDRMLFKFAPKRYFFAENVTLSLSYFHLNISRMSKYTRSNHK